VRGVVVLVVGLLVLGAVPASAGTADVGRNGPCSGDWPDEPDLESFWTLKLTDVGDRIEVRFVVHHSMDQPWRFVLRHGRAGPEAFGYGDGDVFFEDVRTGPYLSPDVGVRTSVRDLSGDDGFAAKAVRPDHLCRAHAKIG